LTFRAAAGTNPGASAQSSGRHVFPLRRERSIINQPNIDYQ
jgi:hypothetical protein